MKCQNFHKTTRGIKVIYFSRHYYRTISTLYATPFGILAFFNGEGHFHVPNQFSLTFVRLWTAKLYSSCLLAWFVLKIRPFLLYIAFFVCFLPFFAMATATLYSKSIVIYTLSFVPCRQQSFKLVVY